MNDFMFEICSRFTFLTFCKHFVNILKMWKENYTTTHIHTTFIVCMWEKVYACICNCPEFSLFLPSSILILCSCDILPLSLGPGWPCLLLGLCLIPHLPIGSKIRVCSWGKPSYVWCNKLLSQLTEDELLCIGDTTPDFQVLSWCMHHKPRRPLGHTWWARAALVLSSFKRHRSCCVN